MKTVQRFMTISTLVLATSAFGATAELLPNDHDQQSPTSIVVRVSPDGKTDVMTLTGAVTTEIPADDLSSIAAAADIECDQLRIEAVAYYLRIAREPTHQDVLQIRENACSVDTSCATRAWKFNKQIGRFHVYADGECVNYSSGRGHAYFPVIANGGTYENINIPRFGVTYNGYGNPFDWTGYTIMRAGYAYFFYAPRFRY